MSFKIQSSPPIAQSLIVMEPIDSIRQAVHPDLLSGVIEKVRHFVEQLPPPRSSSFETIDPTRQKIPSLDPNTFSKIIRAIPQFLTRLLPILENLQKGIAPCAIPVIKLNRQDRDNVAKAFNLDLNDFALKIALYLDVRRPNCIRIPLQIRQLAQKCCAERKITHQAVAAHIAAYPLLRTQILSTFQTWIKEENAKLGFILLKIMSPVPTAHPKRKRDETTPSLRAAQTQSLDPKRSKIEDL